MCILDTSGSETALKDREQETPSGRQLLAAWWAVLGGFAPLLAIGAVMLYAFLNFAYDRFYGPLGVDPGDVGLTYGSTLARSSGFVITYLLIATVLLSIPLSILIFRRRRGRRGSTVGLNAVMALIGLVLFLLFLAPVRGADFAVREVQHGNPTGSIHFLDIGERGTFLLMLAVHADPATVEPAGKPEDTPGVERLRSHTILYLGQANGTVVLYDANAQQAIYVPANSIILHVSNCYVVPYPDPACGNFHTN